MGLRVLPIGGFGEIGRNCCAIQVDDEVVLLDLGLQMEQYIRHTEDEEFVAVSGKTLMDIGAAPDLTMLDDLRKQVVGICLTHAHLDHVGAVPYLAGRFDCPIHGTPFTVEVLRRILADEKVQLRNPLVAHRPSATFRLTPKISVEFVYVTHSTPQTVIIVLHTPYGDAMYANDWKLDNCPTLGPRTDVARMQRLRPRVLICDALYSQARQKTPSEMIAREMLKDVLLGTPSTGRAVVVTTFSSHIARLKSLVELGERMGRRVAFVGRSLAKYTEAAEACGLVDWRGHIKIVKYGSQASRFFRTLTHPEKWLLVVTGHQGEPKATLAKMAAGLYHFRPGDHVVFSCNVIPVSINKENRRVLETKMEGMHLRLFKDIHVSGHASREDHRDFLEMLQPAHLLPTHGFLGMQRAFRELAHDMGWDLRAVHLAKNGDRLEIK